MGKKQKKTDPSLLARNKKAYFNYNILEKLEVGICLKGTEVKSLRSKNFSFTDSFIEIFREELWLKKFYIAPYERESLYNHRGERERKLLAHRREIEKWHRKVKEKGVTVIPLKIYLKGPLIKLQIGLCRGKREFDKRESIKVKDLRRENDRLRKSFS